jgi:hypothetical protein
VPFCSQIALLQSCRNEIVIGKRTVISYLLDPIVRLFDESLREP